MANELPVILRQIDSIDPAVQAAARMRMADFARMLAPWRGKKISRRHLIGAGTVTFAAMSIKRDD